jgi:hypothetical protein
MPFEPLRPLDLGLILTYQCQAACAHCLYNCGPVWKEWIDESTLNAMLTAAASLGEPLQVHLTGGEPFLKFDLLRHAVEMASALGLYAYVETNAGWCTNDAVVEERFSILRVLGLKAVLISCSPFHAERIPPRKTLRAIQQAFRIFGQHRTMIYQSEWLEVISQFGLDEPVPLKIYQEKFGQDEAGRWLWQGYGLISGGRSGYRLGHLTQCLPADAFRKANCQEELLFAQHSHFDLYGNYIPGFCGGLSLGDWHELDQIREQYAQGQYPSLIRILIKSGPFGLFQLAEETYGYQALSGGYAGKCHLCVDVRKHLATCRKFDELRPRQFYEMIA